MCVCVCVCVLSFGALHTSSLGDLSVVGRCHLMPFATPKLPSLRAPYGDTSEQPCEKVSLVGGKQLHKSIVLPTDRETLHLRTVSNYRCACRSW